MELLEEKFLTGQISENLYMQLKDKYAGAAAKEVGVGMPIEGAKAEGGAPGASPQPQTGPVQVSVQPQPQPQVQPPQQPAQTIVAIPIPQPPQPRTDWKKEEDVLNSVKMPSAEEQSESGKKLKKVKKL
jgi:hypothetical protein